MWPEEGNTIRGRPWETRHRPRHGRRALEVQLQKYLQLCPASRLLSMLGWLLLWWGRRSKDCVFLRQLATRGAFSPEGPAPLALVSSHPCGRKEGACWG